METGPLSWNIYVSASHDGWQLEKSVANGGRDIGTNASARPPLHATTQTERSTKNSMKKNGNVRDDDDDGGRERKDHRDG